LLVHMQGVPNSGSSATVFNVFGMRQALSNPYTGVLAITAARLLNDRPSIIYKDGLQRRDFVSVYDVVPTCRLTLKTLLPAQSLFNIGSGRSYTIREAVAMLSKALGKKHIEPRRATVSIVLGM
jgi:dTDP-L-rhamnose 4-epimerase